MSEVGRCSDDETATPQKMFTAAHHAWAQEHPSLADDCLHELLGYNCMRKRCTADDGVSLHLFLVHVRHALHRQRSNRRRVNIVAAINNLQPVSQTRQLI